MKARWIFPIFLILIVLDTFGAQAAWVFDNGEMQKKEDAPYLAPQEHYRRARVAFEKGKWGEAVDHFHIVSVNYSDRSFGQDSYFFLGLAYYNLGDYDLANTAINDYLSCQSNPRYFEESIEYKYCIAENLRQGAKRHFYGSRHMPRWGSGKMLALDIYEEVIAAMPSHDFAVKSLYSKACLQWQLKQYRECVESYQAVIHRFPKHELAPVSYEQIIKVYISQAKREVQNPDLLAFAEINLSKFESDFPREERLEVAHKDFMYLKEIYAKGLFDIGRFYERICQPLASVIYYQKAVCDFPDTRTAQVCRRRLICLCPEALEFEPVEKQKVEEEFPGVLDDIDFVLNNDFNEEETIV